MAKQPETQTASPVENINVEQVLLEDMQRRTSELKKDLMPLLQTSQSNIQEEDFIRYFLPLFAGDYAKEASKFSETLVQWYRVAGSPFASVNVVKNGQIVAVVPAVKKNILSGRHSGRLDDVGMIFENAKQRATLHPKFAQNATVAALHERFLTNIPRPDLSEEQRKWFDLLNRYGRAPKSMLAQASAPSVQAQSDDDFEYE